MQAEQRFLVDAVEQQPWKPYSENVWVTLWLLKRHNSISTTVDCCTFLYASIEILQTPEEAKPCRHPIVTVNFFNLIEWCNNISVGESNGVPGITQTTLFAMNNRSNHHYTVAELNALIIALLLLPRWLSGCSRSTWRSSLVVIFPLGSVMTTTAANLLFAFFFFNERHTKIKRREHKPASVTNRCVAVKGDSCWYLKKLFEKNDLEKRCTFAVKSENKSEKVKGWQCPWNLHNYVYIAKKYIYIFKIYLELKSYIS